MKKKLQLFRYIEESRNLIEGLRNLIEGLRNRIDRLRNLIKGWLGKVRLLKVRYNRQY
jgi:hypothetical protein